MAGALPPLIAAAVGSLPGCSVPTECDCGPHHATILIPEICATTVDQISVSEPCSLSYEGDGRNPSTVQVKATAEGTCQVDVTFTDSPGQRLDIDFMLIEGECCNGTYPKHQRRFEVSCSPPSAQAIDPALEPANAVLP